MAGFSDGRSLTELLGSLAGDITSLFRKEVQLAKAEASEKLTEMASSAVQIVIGAILALGALGVLLTAAVAGLSMLLENFGVGARAANALSALIVAVIVGLIAWLFVSRGLNGLKARNLKLERTTTSLQRDAAAVKEKF
ncbi:MAG: phage holin family protein [Mesorhizobium amorphae]|nr:MAG: phage holin family protein [Mesorhizobium amorphae]